MENYKKLREKAIKATRQALKESVNEDNHIIQTISAIEEIDKNLNTLSKRLREWYELYSPEFSKKITDHETFVKRILEKTREEQMKDLGITETMGADINKEDLSQIRQFTNFVKTIFEEKRKNEEYLEKIMNRRCPNITILAGANIGAKLLREAKGLQKLCTVPAGTIQLYGAEKALFRHLKTGARPPKYGYIINNPLIIKADKKIKGKVSRALADKISIAAKVDFFKGEAIGETLLKELEDKFK